MRKSLWHGGFYCRKTFSALNCISWDFKTIILMQKASKCILDLVVRLYCIARKEILDNGNYMFLQRN